MCEKLWREEATVCVSPPNLCLSSTRGQGGTGSPGEWGSSIVFHGTWPPVWRRKVQSQCSPASRPAGCQGHWNELHALGFCFILFICGVSLRIFWILYGTGEDWKATEEFCKSIKWLSKEQAGLKSLGNEGVTQQCVGVMLSLGDAHRTVSGILAAPPASEAWVF